ncbi:MAG: DUF6268 family outer membrane beta-barrel protein [Verrucomicrobiota bacterium]|nr:DUF6268 family outer membrane beta-barrel protein [Verrucomicrobiota bacterium]
MKIRYILFLIAFGLLCPQGILFAQSSDSSLLEDVNPIVPAKKMNISYEVNSANGYGFSSSTKQPNQNGQKLSVLNDSLDVTIAPKISNNFILRTGVGWGRFSLFKDGSVPLPDTLQSVYMKIGFDTIIGNDWIVRVEAMPGVYSDFTDVTTDDISMEMIVGASYLMNENFQWMFGVGLGMFRQIPIFPAVGFRWQFEDNWNLNLMLPNPRLSYSLNKQVDLYLGGSLLGGTFRTGPNNGTQNNDASLNNAMLDYIEARTGVGVKYNVTPAISIDADAGYTVFRQFDYYRSDMKVKADPAPYVSLSVTSQF